MDYLTSFEELFAIESDFRQLIGKINIDGSVNSENRMDSKDYYNHDLTDVFKNTPRYKFCNYTYQSFYEIYNINFLDKKSACNFW